MQYKYFFVLALLFYVSIPATNAFGCKIGVSRVSSFNPTFYVFIGEIVDVESVEFESQGITAEAVGFRVKVVDRVHLPRLAENYVVFPLRLTPSCGLRSDTAELRKSFKVGSRVRVVATEARVIKKDGNESVTISLETSPGNRTSFVRNDLTEDLRASANTNFDYRAFSPPERWAPDVTFESNRYLPAFELRKDLVRLEGIKFESERTKILERLVYYPYVSEVDFVKIARIYISDEKRLASLEEKWEQRGLEFNSKRK